MATNLKSIKIDNVRSVFSSVTKNKTISRLDISEKTGLSRVTVGKIADALIMANILSEEKKINNCAGRRAGMLSLNSDMVAVIASIDRDGAKILICDLSLGTRESFSSSNDDNELVNIVADASMSVLDKYGADNCIGVSIIVSPGLDEKHFSELFSSFFPGMIVTVNSPVSLSARYFSAGMGEDEMLIYVRAGIGHTHGTIYMNNSHFASRGARGVDFGKIVLSGGKTLEEKLADCTERDEQVAVFSDCMCNTAMVVLPDRVVIEMDGDCYSADIAESVNDCARRRLGEREAEGFSIIKADADISSAYRGAMHSLFEKWLESFVLEN